VVRFAVQPERRSADRADRKIRQGWRVASNASGRKLIAVAGDNFFSSSEGGICGWKRVALQSATCPQHICIVISQHV